MSVEQIRLTTTNMIYFEGGVHTSQDIKKGKTETLQISSFYLDKSPVTVAQFAALASAKKYITEAEKFGNSGVFDYATRGWKMKDSAYYLYPMGHNAPAAADNHPVTQVSWNDAKWYCDCLGKRLPSRYEWEYAARFDVGEDAIYAWGNDLIVNEKYMTNTWQGDFPDTNTIADGFVYTAPVGIFGKTKSGLTDMGGNIWQWCLEDVEVIENGEKSKHKIMKGGSFLCDPQYCHGFMIDNYSDCSPETGLSHIGFRCAVSKP